jgi:DNA-binding transcriptional LysR family regulator
MTELADGAGGNVRFAAIEPAASERVTPLLGRLRRTRRACASASTSPARGRRPGRGRRGGRRRPVARRPPPSSASASSRSSRRRWRSSFPPRTGSLERGRSRRRTSTASRCFCPSRDAPIAPRSSARCRSGALRPSWAFESGSSQALRAAVRHGLGVAVLPRASATPPPPGASVRRLSDLADLAAVSASSLARARPRRRRRWRRCFPSFDESCPPRQRGATSTRTLRRA